MYSDGHGLAMTTVCTLNVWTVLKVTPTDSYSCVYCKFKTTNNNRCALYTVNVLSRHYHYMFISSLYNYVFSEVAFIDFHDEKDI